MVINTIGEEYHKGKGETWNHRVYQYALLIDKRLILSQTDNVR